jgi:hypothetical protein
MRDPSQSLAFWLMVIAMQKAPRQPPRRIASMRLAHDGSSILNETTFHWRLTQGNYFPLSECRETSRQSRAASA